MSTYPDRARRAGRIVTVPTRVSARVVRGSVVTTYRSMRFAVRSSLISFVLGAGLGWFLTTPTGRYLLASLRESVLPPAVAPPDDESLAAAVRTEIAAAPTTWHLPQPEVAVAEGHVTLRGDVPHAEGREALLLVAAGVPGVASVVDVLDLTDAVAPSV
jgi:hypothetical protein